MKASHKQTLSFVLSFLSGAVPVTLLGYTACLVWDVLLSVGHPSHETICTVLPPVVGIVVGLGLAIAAVKRSRRGSGRSGR